MRELAEVLKDAISKGTVHVEGCLVYLEVPVNIFEELSTSPGAVHQYGAVRLGGATFMPATKIPTLKEIVSRAKPRLGMAQEVELELSERDFQSLRHHLGFPDYGHAVNFIALRLRGTLFVKAPK